MRCRACGGTRFEPVLDLGTAPPANAYLAPEDLARPERWYPLRLAICRSCGLVQTEDFVGREELFAPDYAYLSGTSSTWRDHVRRHATEMTARFGLGPDSFVVEVASNDGTALLPFREAGIPCLGIEPTALPASVARAAGVETVQRFFGIALAEELAAAGRRADAIIANNVLAHVPDLDDFVGGLARLLAPGGVLSLEFQDVVSMVRGNQFDTAYHEHYSYFCLTTAKSVLDRHGLSVFDVVELPTHGGSLRVYAQRAGEGSRPVCGPVAERLAFECGLGATSFAFFADFQSRAEAAKMAFLRFLLAMRQAGRRVVGYGAAAKASTLLNFAGVRGDLLPVVYDAAASKQGKFIPGARISVCSPEEMRWVVPDCVVIFPWNIRDEIVQRLVWLRAHGTRFATAIPTFELR